MKTVYFIVSGSMIICQVTEDTYTLAVWKDGISHPWDTSYATFEDACHFKHILERKHGFKYMYIESMQVACNTVSDDPMGDYYGRNI